MYFNTPNQINGDLAYSQGDYVKALSYYSSAMEILKRFVATEKRQSSQAYYAYAYVLAEMAGTRAMLISQISNSDLSHSNKSEQSDQINGEFQANYMEAKQIAQNYLRGREKSYIRSKLNEAKGTFQKQMHVFYWNLAIELSELEIDCPFNKIEILEQILEYIEQSRECFIQSAESRIASDRRNELTQYRNFELKVKYELSKSYFTIGNDAEISLITLRIRFLQKAAELNRGVFAKSIGTNRVVTLDEEYSVICGLLRRLQSEPINSNEIQNYLVSHGLNQVNLGLGFLNSNQKVSQSIKQFDEIHNSMSY